MEGCTWSSGVRVEGRRGEVRHEVIVELTALVCVIVTMQDVPCTGVSF